MPYHVLGWSAGALRRMSAWSRSPIARKGAGHAAIFVKTAASDSAAFAAELTVLLDFSVAFFSAIKPPIVGELLKYVRRHKTIHGAAENAKRYP
jgi:hypothetical protein